MMEIRLHGEVVFSCPPLPWFTLPSVQPCIISLITPVYTSLCTPHTPHIFTPRLPAPDSCSSAALCRARNTASRWVMQNCKTGSSVRGCEALPALCMNGWTRSRGLSHVSSRHEQRHASRWWRARTINILATRTLRTTP